MAPRFDLVTVPRGRLPWQLKEKQLKVKKFVASREDGPERVELSL
jgi:hypothetical protein